MTYFPRYPNGARTTAESQTINIATDQLPAGFAQRVDEVSASEIYIGYAPAGSTTSDSVWMIKKIEVVGTETIITWAEAGIFPGLVWDDRLDYTYE